MQDNGSYFASGHALAVYPLKASENSYTDIWGKMKTESVTEFISGLWEEFRRYKVVAYDDWGIDDGGK
jgi:hypothetical protein